MTVAPHGPQNFDIGEIWLAPLSVADVVPARARDSFCTCPVCGKMGGDHYSHCYCTVCGKGG